MPDRRARNRFARRLAVFGPALIVVLTGMLSYAALERVQASRTMVMHTHDVLDASTTLMTALLDAETGQRGYLLTHDTAFLDPYYGTRPRAVTAIARLSELTRDNTVQQRRLDTLRVKVARRLLVLDSTIKAEREGRTDLSSGIVRFGPGRSLMTDIRRLITDIRAEEEGLLAERRRREATSSELAAAALLIGTLIAAALAFSVNTNFDRALRDRRIALAESNDANQRLQQQTEQARQALAVAEESERRTERLQAATEAFTSALSINEVANLIVDQALHALGAASGGLAVLEHDGKALRFVASRNIRAATPGTVIDVDQPYPMCRAVRERAPVLIADRSQLEREHPAIVPLHDRENIHAVAIYPLQSEDRILGAIIVRFTEPHPLSAADRSFMGALSRIAAETFERARLFEAEREARAAAETANRAKAAFLASMSHELRTPLQAALGFAQLVRSGVYGEVNEQQSEVLGRVERSQTHLARLIDDILDFARIEAGRVRVAREPVALVDVINDLIPLVEPQAAKRKIELSLLPPPETLRVIADRQRLRQVLVNLVGNAIKFTPENGTVRVGALRNGSRATIAITDTGRGIPQDRLQAIFEPFVQVEDSLTRTAAGAGLGLAISRDLARAMGGDVTVESELGKGSTFSVVLPLAE